MFYLIYSVGMLLGLLHVIYITHRDRVELKALVTSLDSDELQDFAFDFVGYATVTVVLWWIVLPSKLYNRLGG